MNAKQCDACGEFYRPSNAQAEGTYLKSIETTQEMTESKGAVVTVQVQMIPVNAHSSKIDLCPQCLGEAVKTTIRKLVANLGGVIFNKAEAERLQKGAK